MRYLPRHPRLVRGSRVTHSDRAIIPRPPRKAGVTGLALLLCVLCFPATALTVDVPLPDSTQESRAKALFTEIRCVVCQSEAIADSPAEIARDMRRTIREEIAAGSNEESIKSKLVALYGDEILMKPPLKNHLVLWLAPLFLLLTGGVFAWRRLFR